MSLTRAQEVIDIHTRMTDVYRQPNPFLLTGVRAFMENTAQSAYDEGGENEVADAMTAMFYPCKDERELTARIGAELFSARTFQVTDEMCEAVSGTFRNSSKTIGHVQTEEVPAECGFVWLDTPFSSFDRHGRKVSTRAVSWSPQAFTYQDGTVAPGFRVTCWHHPNDKDDWWEPEEAAAAAKTGAPLALSHSLVMPFGQRFGGHDGTATDMYADDFLHWLHTLWVFLDSEIAVSRQADLARPFRKRAAKSLKYPGLNVVMLRRLRPVGDPGHEPEHRPVDWSVRWVVQGHHRHLDKYDGPRHHASPLPHERGRCITCLGRITWVHAYLKGPDGLPLRSAQQLYRLGR